MKQPVSGKHLFRRDSLFVGSSVCELTARGALLHLPCPALPCLGEALGVGEPLPGCLPSIHPVEQTCHAGVGMSSGEALLLDVACAREVHDQRPKSQPAAARVLLPCASPE